MAISLLIDLLTLLIDLLMYVVLPALLLTLAIEEIRYHGVVKRCRQAERAKFEARRIAATLRSIGAQQSSDLSAAAMNACVALLNEALRASSATADSATPDAGVVNSTATAGGAANRASTGAPKVSHRSW
jgi:hypothetical protein